MDLVGVMYTILFSVLGFTIIVVLAIVAGKEIVMAFKRRFAPRGCEVFVANSNRNISHYYMVPKEGIFRIYDLPYITNPEKTMNLDEDTKQRVIDSILKISQKYKTRIAEMDKKIKLLLDKYEESDKKTQIVIKSQIVHLEGIKKTFEARLRTKQENYYKDKRPAFFYIEGDPVPKDFYEWYSTLDARMVDNLVARKISQPANIQKQEKDLQTMRILCIVAAIAGGVAAFLAVRNNTMLMEICRNAGLNCGLV